MRNKLIEVARRLRKKQTPQEHKLWAVLRNRKVMDCKFRRQQPIGPYVVDFYCHEKKLVIELDGGHHAEEDQRDRDLTRDAFLEGQGDTVLRFWNNEVDNNLEGVVESIVQHLDKSPSPHSSPSRERKRIKKL